MTRKRKQADPTGEKEKSLQTGKHLQKRRHRRVSTVSALILAASLAFGNLPAELIGTVYAEEDISQSAAADTEEEAVPEEEETEETGSTAGAGSDQEESGSAEEESSESGDSAEAAEDPENAGGDPGAEDDRDEEAEAAESETDESDSYKDSGDEDGDSDLYADDELIIVYEDEILELDETVEVDDDFAEEIMGDDSAEVTLEDAGVLEQEEIVPEDGDQGAVVLAQIDEDASVEELAEELSNDPDIAWAQPNYSYELLETTTDDPYLVDDSTASKNQYYLFESGFTEAWDTVKAEGSVTVAVLDTGCNLRHEDLQGTVLDEYAYDVKNGKLLSKSGVANNGDSYGHGTMVCGIIAAYAGNGAGIAGASYNANILPVRIYDDVEGCSTSDMVSAYAYLDGLIDSGKVTDLRVINISLGYYADSLDDADRALEEAIEEMREENGVLTVCAGGNGDSSGALTDSCYPADFDACISVTSVDADGSNSSWSDYNAQKDISAYGENILSTNNSGGYTKGTGTSFASPQVAAAAALLWAADGTLTPDEVVDYLEDTASVVTGNEHKSSGSAGILDAETAVEAVLEDAVPAAVTLSSVTLSTSLTSATIKWSKVSGATGYQIYRSSDGGSTYSKIKTITSGSTTSYTNSSLSLGKTYKYKVRAYATLNVGTYYGSFSSAKSVTTKPSTVSIKSASTTTGGYVKVSWSKVSNATGYVIYRSTNGGSYSKVKTISSSSTTSWTDSSVKPGRVYRYKIRSYKKSGSTTVYSSSYSSVKKVTAKPAKVTITSVSSSSSRSAKVKWNKVSNATGYQVAYRRKGSSTWNYVTVSTNYKKVTSLRKKNYYVKVRAYTKYNGTKYYGSWSSEKYMKVK